MSTVHVSGELLSGGQSQKVTTSTTSAQSTAITFPTGWPAGIPYPVMVVVDVLTFARQGSNPTAVSDGTDQVLVANTVYRFELQTSGNKIAFKAGGAGNAYITPGF